MFRKSYLYLILAAVVALSAQMTVYSQFGPVNGKVVLDKGGPKPEPVVGALIEIYRTDAKGGFDPLKTNKNGEFFIAGMPYGAEYVFSVSAPNCTPVLFPKVRAGQEKLVITMSPGDGRKFTEAEARKGVADAPKGGSPDPGESEEEKKDRAEKEKQNAEITARNEKMKNADAIAAKTNTEGWVALKAGEEATNISDKARNYELALTKFNEGIAAVPDYVGSTPVLLNGKMVALKNKGVLVYKEGVPLSDAAAKKAKFDEANKLMDDALAAYQDAIAILKKASPDPAAIADARTQSVSKALHAEAMEIHRLKALSGVDLSKSAEANATITEYIAMEQDPEKKISAQMVLGDIMRRTGDFEKAVAAYRQVLALKPDHAEATGQLGLSLFGLGSSVVPEDKEKEQEGLNYMQKYIDMSPVSPTDSTQVKELKTSIKDALDYLKKEKMTPQKVPTTPKKRN